MQKLTEYQELLVITMEDCSDTVLEPDYELLKAIQTVLEYYMTAEELELWNNYEKNNSHQS
jgi:hypothetical protein